MLLLPFFVEFIIFSGCEFEIGKISRVRIDFRKRWRFILKESGHSNGFDTIINEIDQLIEEDAKAFLKIIYTRFNLFEKGNGAYTSERLIDDVLSTFKRIPTANEIREKRNFINEKNDIIKGLYEAHLPVSNLTSSIEFYKKLGLEIAYKSDKLAFFWIKKGESWLGLWETDKVKTPYHASLRHIAFKVELEDIKKAKQWLEQRGIPVRTAFGFSPENQPLVLPNNPQAHAAIYFDDPDGNSIELITPLRLDFDEDFSMMTLEEWISKKKNKLE